MVKKEKLSWSSNAGKPYEPESGNRTVHSLTPEELKIAYQPIVDLQKGEAYAYEALVRCEVEEYVNPTVLFKQAVKEDRCGHLGRKIRDAIFSDNVGTRLFINVHPDELRSRWLVRPDDPICYSKEEIFLEVTESATLQYYDLCVSVLKEVCSRTGAHLVIDDLGAGYSNLKRIVDLYPAMVKLDLALARDLDKNKRKRILVTHLVQLCVELDAKVVIEGIETLDELKAACDTGAHYAQGYYLAGPAFPPPHVSWPL
jgi:EAL domain-containing protein (putative c-di-GMP-specific phosphodiesterase class I)